MSEMKLTTKKKSNILKAIYCVLVILFILFLGITVSLNQLLPTENENEFAINLVKTLKNDTNFNSKQILFDTKRDLVEINVYGLLDLNSQESLINQAQKFVPKNKFQGKVEINFYPVREVIKTELPNGVQLSEFTDVNVIRQVTIQGEK